jgi:hypothetical protein
MTTGYTDGVIDECRNGERSEEEELGRKGGSELVEIGEILEKFSHLKHKDLAGAYLDVNTWDVLPALTILLFSICRRKLLRGPTEFKKATLYSLKAESNLVYF